MCYEKATNVFVGAVILIWTCWQMCTLCGSSFALRIDPNKYIPLTLPTLHVNLTWTETQIIICSEGRLNPAFPLNFRHEYKGALVLNSSGENHFPDFLISFTVQFFSFYVSHHTSSWVCRNFWLTNHTSIVSGRSLACKFIPDTSFPNVIHYRVAHHRICIFCIICLPYSVWKLQKRKVFFFFLISYFIHFSIPNILNNVWRIVFICLKSSWTTK